jgi:hypothetical protein
MNVTFDRLEALRLFRLLKKDRSPAAQWLRVSASGDSLEITTGAATVTMLALVLEPGAFTTRRAPFERLLESFSREKTLTLQADAGRFRIGSFSGQLLDYEADPGGRRSVEN